MIKRKKIEVGEERRILSQMIVSTPYLSSLKGIAEPYLFKSPYSNTVANWIWEYFDFTGEAPVKGIEEIYLKNQHTIQDEEENELIGEFLTKLSEDWEKNKIKNVKYSVKNAIEFFKLRSLEVLKREIDEAVQSKNAKHGERVVADYKRVEKLKGHGVNFLKDAGAIKSAFQMDNEVLFSYPKELGYAMGPFVRGDFFAWMGSAKKGKSWMLMYTAVRAVLMSMKTVFISLEMNESPVIRRLWKGFTGVPDKKGSIEIPVFREGGKDNKFKVVKEVRKKKGVDLENIESLQRKYEKASRGGELRLQTYPSDSVTVKDIEDYLTNLEYYEGFIPDVIVIDYADNLLAENTRIETRHQINSIWKSLRGIAQARECLLVTATQTNDAGGDKDSGMGNVAEDKRKLTHITKMAILNQNELEVDSGVMRVKLAAQREERSFTKELVLLQGLGIGRPYLDCKLLDNVDMERFKIKKDKKKK